MSGPEVERMRVSMERSRPFGDNAWVARTAGRLDLEHTIRPEGRPRKEQARGVTPKNLIASPFIS
jgi:hypothetical protein